MNRPATLRVFACLLFLGAGPAAADHGAHPPSAFDRAEAFPDLAGAAAHMDDDPLHGMFLVDRLEWQDADGGDTLHWKTRAWLGRDTGRLWLRAEGERPRGAAGTQELELLWGMPVAAWWDFVAGVHREVGAGPSRTFGALGVQGVAPYGLEIEATAYLGDGGQAGAKLDVEYELLLTNRLVLVPEVEAAAWGRDDEARGIGSGLSSLTAGLRLRYEFRREFAPYLGVEWSGSFGGTADAAREAGDAVRDTRVVAGLRVWF